MMALHVTDAACYCIGHSASDGDCLFWICTYKDGVFYNGETKGIHELFIVAKNIHVSLCVVVVEIKHGLLHPLSTLFKYFICHLL